MITFNQAAIVGNELKYIEQAVNSRVISGEGHFIKKCEEFLATLMGNGSTVLLTPSCTHALEMCALLLNVGPGDEIILPSYTFVTTATAFALRGAKIVFADIDPQTLNIDPDEIAKRITPATKAIVVVHYGGVSCDMNKIMALADRYGISVVEDAAHALGSFYKGKPLGTFGKLSTFSFHETKNVTCGEGGALVINDPTLVERAHILRDKGTNRKQFQRGDTPFYTWVDIGSSYVMSDIQAAFLFAQLEHLDELNKRRRDIHARYTSALEPLKSAKLLAYPTFDSPSDSTAHIFFILLESRALRDELKTYLLKKQILSIFHYQPLHQSPFVEQQWGKQPNLPVTEDLAHRLLRLPMYNSLKTSEVDYIAESIATFFKDR